LVLADFYSSGVWWQCPYFLVTGFWCSGCCLYSGHLKGWVKKLLLVSPGVDSVREVELSTLWLCFRKSFGIRRAYDAAMVLLGKPVALPITDGFTGVWHGYGGG